MSAVENQNCERNLECKISVETVGAQKCHPVEHEECVVEYQEVCEEAVEARCQVGIVFVTE